MKTNHWTMSQLFQLLLVVEGVTKKMKRDAILSWSPMYELSLHVQLLDADLHTATLEVLSPSQNLVGLAQSTV